MKTERVVDGTTGRGRRRTWRRWRWRQWERRGGVEEEAESAFTCVDDEMKDAFVDESEIEPASEFTAGFGGVPTRFETKEVEKSFRQRRRWKISGDEPTSAEDEDDSDSVETKERCSSSRIKCPRR